MRTKQFFNPIFWGRKSILRFQDMVKENASGLERVSVDEILEAQRIEQELKQEQDKIRARALKERGLIYQLDSTQEDF